MPLDTGLSAHLDSHPKERRVDARRLIIAVCNQDKVHAPRELVEAEARRLAEKPAFTARVA